MYITDMKSIYRLSPNRRHISKSANFQKDFVIGNVNIKSAPTEKKNHEKIRTSVSMADQITMYSLAKQKPSFLNDRAFL